MGSDSYVSLHRHDSYSLFDGIDLPVRAADKAKALGQPALALTNHGSVFGIVEHYRVCNERGVKPILGMEAYVVPGGLDVEDEVRGNHFHQTLLVENYTGYKNLMRLVTLSYENFYYKPRIPLRSLVEHGEGLIVLSGCPSSLLQRCLQDGQYDKAERLFAWFVRHFGDRFYAELQHSALAAKTSKALVQMALKYKVPIVATNDAHYVDKEDRAVHDRLLKLRRSGQGEENPTYGEGFHMVGAREMRLLLLEVHDSIGTKIVKDAVEETVRVAERCSLDLEAHKPERMLPPLWGDNPGAALTAMVAEGMRRRGVHNDPKYVDRLKEEMRVIKALKYEEYFLVCNEVTSWARSKGIMIGPRGSVCGSLLAYVLGVTQVDPLIHGTLFERFLHDKKKSFPDVDLDIDARYKDAVHEWFHERFKPYSLPIITFGRYGSGNLSNDLMKMFPEVIDADRKNRLRRAIEEIKNDTRAAFLTYEHLKPYGVFDIVEEDAPGLKRLVVKMYNMARYIGRHPGGVCFVPSDATEWLPKIRVKGQEMASYNFYDVEFLGLLKFDLLGLAAVATVSSAMSMVSARHEAPLTLDNMKLNDPECYKRFSLGQTDGIFQFETRGGRSILQQIEPDDFAELAASTALNRPGVSDNLTKYVQGKKRVLHEGLPEDTGGADARSVAVRALRETFGTFVYQEQIALILQAWGFEWPSIDKFLKGLKLNVKTYAITEETHAKASIYGEVEARLVEMGYSKEKAESFVGRVKQYSFNKAHAIGYAMVAYWMMWLRVHYPLEFWCSLLEMEHDDKKRAAYESASIFDGAVLLPAHVNGTATYSIEGNAIRVGLWTIKGIGAKAAEAIEAGRPYDKPKDIRRLPKRVVNARVIKALLNAGALTMNSDNWRTQAVKYNKDRQSANTGILLRGGKDKVLA